jgi:hypothetical protein
MFVIMTFKKRPGGAKEGEARKKVKWPPLKACVYKRR